MGTPDIRPDTKGHSGVDVFENNRALFETIAGGSLTVKPSPDGRFAVNMKTGELYIGDMFYDNPDLSSPERATVFGTMHETSHIEEMVRLLGRQGGPAQFEQYLERFGRDRAFASLDNCVADIRENRNVITKTNESFANVRDEIYEKSLFPTNDLMTSLNGKHVPRHIQFAECLLRENQLPDQPCNVDSEVRAAVDEIFAMNNKAGKPFMQIMTNPNLSIEERWQLQDYYLVPLMEKLKEQDLEDERNKQQDQQSDTSQSGEDSDGQDSFSLDPNEVFKEFYDELDQKVGSPLQPEDLEQILNEYRETHGEPIDPLENADQNYADKLGVDKNDLQKYRDLAKTVNELKNLKTNKKIVDELEELIHRIIANRKKPKPHPKYPQEEGDYLVDPADLIASVYTGNMTPKVWEDTEMREKLDKRAGEIELTLVCDGSDSMSWGGGVKRQEQLVAAVLLMETLKRFQNIINDACTDIYKQLDISSEIYRFGDTNAGTPIKSMSRELTEKERIDAMVAISKTTGTTNDYDSLSAIHNNLTDETREKIKTGELKKIVIVMTDGESNNASTVQENLEKLRTDGVIVVGVGITEEGKSVLTTYAPDAQVAKQATDLPLVLADLLQEHLNAV
ncbi:VWA domain-containing protein [Candidatus Saccharibacteria bacterium]|nr:VWA domain-containing protein [Candidatus Saccharibacteria bacterium]